MVEVKFVKFNDDWEAMYVNGELRIETHIIYTHDIYNILDVNNSYKIERISYEDEGWEFLSEIHEAPRNFDEVLKFKKD